MGSITWTNTFSDAAYTDLGTQLSENFSDAVAVLNGAVGDSNFTDIAVVQAETASITDVAVVPKASSPAGSNLIMAASVFSDHKIEITNSDDTLLMRITSDLGVTFG